MRAQITCSRPSFSPASTILRFSITRTVWPSMSDGSGRESSSGKVGIWPVTKHQPSTSTAWANGATGVGPPGAMKKIGTLMLLLRWLSSMSVGARPEYQLSQPAGAERSGDLGRGDVDQEAGEQPDLDRREAAPGERRDRFVERDTEAVAVEREVDHQ